MADAISESVKKIFLAGIGAVASTAEKSQSLLDELVKKGELTVEQGKALNEELKHTVKEAKNSSSEKSADKPEDSSAEDILDKFDELSPAQLQRLKEKLAALDETAEDSDGR